MNENLSYLNGVKHSLLAHMLFGFIAKLKNDYSSENILRNFFNLPKEDRENLRVKILSEMSDQKVFFKIKKHLGATKPPIGENSLLFRLERIYNTI